MKYTMFVALTALALAGCHKSPTQQFAKLCDYHKAHDPKEYAAIEKMCREPKYLPDEQKMQLVQGYSELVKARKDAGVEAQQ
jgi:hypothetical protein